MRITHNNIKKDFTIFRKIFMTIVSAFITINCLATRQSEQTISIKDALDQLSYARSMGYWGPIKQLSFQQSINDRPLYQTTNMFFDKKGNILSAEIVNNNTGKVEISMNGNDVLSSMYDKKCHEIKDYIETQKDPVLYYAIIDDQTGMILYLTYFDKHLRPDILLYPTFDTNTNRFGQRSTTVNFYMAKMEYDPLNVNKLKCRKVLFDVATPNDQKLLFDYKYVNSIFNNWGKEKQAGLVVWNTDGSDNYDNYGNPAIASYTTYNIRRDNAGDEINRTVQEKAIQYTNFKYYSPYQPIYTPSNILFIKPNNDKRGITGENSNQPTYTPSDILKEIEEEIQPENNKKNWGEIFNDSIPRDTDDIIISKRHLKFFMIKDSVKVHQLPSDKGKIVTASHFNEYVNLEPGDVVEVLSSNGKWSKIKLYFKNDNNNIGYLERTYLCPSEKLPDNWWKNHFVDKYGIKLDSIYHINRSKYILNNGKFSFENNIAVRVFDNETGNNGIKRNGYVAISYCNGKFHVTYNIENIDLIQETCKILQNAIDEIEQCQDIDEINNITQQTDLKITEIINRYPQSLRDFDEYKAAIEKSNNYQRVYATKTRACLYSALIQMVRQETSIAELNSTFNKTEQLFKNLECIIPATPDEQIEINNALKHLKLEIDKRIKQLQN